MDVSAAVRAALKQKHDNVSHAVRSRGAAGSRAPGFEDAARDQFLKSFKKTGSASSASDAGEVTDDRARTNAFIDPARAQFLKTFTKTPSASSQADLGEGGAKVAFSFSGLRHAVGGA